jgi:hypothetical protein
MQWLREHANLDHRVGWKCKTTGQPIKIALIGRSVWIRPFLGGYGEVRQVGHSYCPCCQPNFELPKLSTPIYEDELGEYWFLDAKGEAS